MTRESSRKKKIMRLKNATPKHVQQKIILVSKSIANSFDNMKVELSFIQTNKNWTISSFFDKDGNLKGEPVVRDMFWRII